MRLSFLRPSIASALAASFLVLVACSGQVQDLGTETDPTGACAEMLDSGVLLAECVGKSCCAEINACIDAPGGTDYESCLLNCHHRYGATAGIAPLDIQRCEDSCGTTHPAAVTPCKTYQDCATNRCFKSP
jgi:hypothetical protein